MKKVEVIGMPMKYGCPVEGADKAYEYLKDSLKKYFFIKSVIDTKYYNPVMYEDDSNIKFITPVMNISKKLYKEVYNSLETGNIPFIVGGDHSTCIGSISAALDYYKGDVTVIYVDQHADIHNDKTTPSGNIHGMPLSICIGRCDKRFDIGKYKLKPENLNFIGLSNYEKEEIDYINDSNIRHYKDCEIEGNEEKIVNEILNNIHTKYVHMSFDLDSICDDDFHAVNVSVDNLYHNGGMKFNTAKKILELLLNNFNVCSIDMVEYNPLLDTDFKCREKVDEILNIIKNSLE
ncbi:MAG: arginase family protein [Bacilli bacterium]|nr:arginase family protein [Bacilli bacterium]